MRRTRSCGSWELAEGAQGSAAGSGVSPTIDFDLVAAPVPADHLTNFVQQAADADLHVRIEEVADALSAGTPAAILELIGAIAGELEARSELGAPEPALVYWAAVRSRIKRPDFEQAMAGLEQRIGTESDSDPEWPETTEGLAWLESLTSGLVPLAGLDVAATLDYARVYMDNFPAFSRPLGDVDERAARWLAQLMDVGEIRGRLRRLLPVLAEAWAEACPRASAQVIRWAEPPVPVDPTQDEPWMRALLVLARTQV